MSGTKPRGPAAAPPATPQKAKPTARARGAVRLATEATLGLSDVVEAMHGRIARLPGLGARPADERTRGITGLVYMAVRGITRVSGAAAETLVGAFATQLEPDATSPRRDAWLAALNGVLGDHLAATGNPLATEMGFHADGQAVEADRVALAAAFGQVDGLLLTVHGLCMNEQQWRRAGQHHGEALAAELGLGHLGLRYNSGRPVAVNGLQLAEQLEVLCAAWPRPLRRMVVLCHSMGGLVVRSAVHQARAAGMAWPALLTELVFLGTPHQGAPLERAGAWVDTVLAAMPYAAPLARLTRLRSAGITDLRHGRVWPAGTPRAVARAALPLPAGVRCFAVAGRLGVAGGGVKGALMAGGLGDGLVAVDSALGRHADAQHALAFARGRTWVAEGVNHMALLSDPGVYERLRGWLAAVPERPTRTGAVR